eukprot:m.237108 g.237108  ORF g.237108 m.237108 type:complete len:79 (+) comp18949_c0_seq14:103-339(+)
MGTWPAAHLMRSCRPVGCSAFAEAPCRELENRIWALLRAFRHDKDNAARRAATTAAIFDLEILKASDKSEKCIHYTKL